MSDAETVKATLLQWAANNALKDAVLSADGSSLSVYETAVPNLTLTIQLADKSCTYSLASIYLQILDPNQGLIAYRNACKKYGVTDPVKALDKPTVVGYFLGSAPPEPSGDAAVVSAGAAAAVDASAPSASVSQADGAGPTAEGAAALDDNDEAAAEARGAAKRRDKHEHRSSRRESKDRHDKRRASDGGSSTKHHHRDAKKKKKKTKHMVTNEQLISNLSMVVDKRQLEQKAQQEITQALSAEGFQVTPELLQEHREATQLLLANEIPVGNSASILRATNPKKNLSRVLELYLESVNPAKHASKAKPGHRPAAGGASSSGSGAASSKPFRTYLMGKKPVILVPKGMTAPITLTNAHEFLCNGRFVPRDVLQKQGRQRSPATAFTRKVRSHGGGSSGAAGLLEYEIMDNPKKLGPNLKEWERIVAVIVLGQSWQFKDWPAPYNDPVQLFARTYGYYVSMEGDKIPPEIQGWAVKQGRLNRDKRGLDSVTHASFWNGLDEFMAVHKAELLPQQQDI